VRLKNTSEGKCSTKVAFALIQLGILCKQRFHEIRLDDRYSSHRESAILVYIYIIKMQKTRFGLHETPETFPPPPCASFAVGPLLNTSFCGFLPGLKEK
jgi:hypothetical protein